MAKEKAQKVKKEQAAPKACRKIAKLENQCKVEENVVRVKKTKKSLTETIQKEISELHDEKIKPFNAAFKALMIASQFVEEAEYCKIQAKYQNRKKNAQNWKKLVEDIGILADKNLSKPKKRRKTKRDNFRYIRRKILQERSRGCRLKFLAQKYGINVATVYSWLRELKAEAESQQHSQNQQKLK